MAIYGPAATGGGGHLNYKTDNSLISQIRRPLPKRMVINMENHSKTNDSQVNVPIWEKVTLTLPEAAALYNIGINRLRELSDNDRCNFVLFVGNKRLIKRKQFDQYLEDAYSI